MAGSLCPKPTSRVAKWAPRKVTTAPRLGVHWSAILRRKFGIRLGLGIWGLDGDGSHLDFSPDLEDAWPGGLEEAEIDEIASDTQDLAFEEDYGFE
jgi:hypothetical protein